MLLLYLYYTLSFYAAKTAFSSDRKFYFRKFALLLGSIVKTQLRQQSNRKLARLNSIHRLVDKNLPKASEELIKFAIENPDLAEGYFYAAEALYLRGRYCESIDVFFAKGLRILDENNRRLGLHSLNARFITPESWGFNIGHISHIDFLIKLRDLGLLSNEERLIYTKRRWVSNHCYLDYWSEHIDVVYLDEEDYSYFINFAGKNSEYLSCLKLKQGFTNLYSSWNLAERSWETKQLPPLLKLREFDKQRGLEIFEKLKIPLDAWFVALHVREGDKRVTRSNSNASISNYIKAIRSITDSGGYVIRMGHAGMTPLPKMEKVIDYANSEHKSDWMDVFLWASCRFFVGTSSGPLTVPPTFGRPVLYTNCPAIGINPYLPNSLMLPKLYLDNTKKQLFSFREMLSSSLGWTVASSFEGIDCTILDNSEDEIEMAVIEMMEASEINKPLVLSGLQNRFNEIRNEYGDTGQITISRSFIEKYDYLLS